ncbi:Signal transduction histidine kinase [Colwellia chukchiensis]|uniref:Sensory/regulatory protein RpfC n=2 Tax=Colwellia chukchiensis TaxID=641665 RepID=A0A1H7TUV1_9GAMM|nr:Signal transduction histidine kinase [Colwellia chukchiensis]
MALLLMRSLKILQFWGRTIAAALTLFVLTSTFLLTSAAKASQQVAKQNDTTIASKAVIVGIPTMLQSSMEADPELFQTETLILSQMRNFSISFWRNWGETFGYQVSFKDVPYMDPLPALMRDEIQIVAMGTYTESYADKVYFSLPYLEIPSALYRAAGEISTPKTIAIHAPKGAYIPLIEQQKSLRTYSEDLNTLLDENTHFDFLYSWQPKRFKQNLIKRQLRDQYQRIDHGNLALSIRSIVSRKNRALMRDINEGLRRMDRQAATELWYSVVPTDKEQQYLRLILGHHLPEISLPLQEYVIDYPVLKYGTLKQGYPPYQIIQNNQILGLSEDLFRLISLYTGVEFQPVTYPSFQQQLHALQRQEISILATVNKSQQREEALLFTSAIDNASTVLVSKKNNNIRSLEGLGTQRLVVIRSFLITDIIKEKFPNSNFVYVDTVPDALKALATGRADAFVGNTLNTEHLLKRFNYTQFQLQHIELDDAATKFHMAVEKTNAPLQQLLNIGLNSIDEQQLQQLQFKWHGHITPVRNNHQQIDKLNAKSLITQVITVLIICLLLMLFLVFKYYRFKADIRISLNQAQKSQQLAERSEQAKSEFLARMSHEIRTPMNGVLGMAEALSFTSLDETQQDLLNTLNRSANNLMALLNDVLDFSKLEAGKFTLENIPMNLSTLAKDVLDSFSFQLNQKGLESFLTLDNSLHSSYYGDPTRCQQVLNNLISNAIKFTETGHIELSITRLDYDQLIKDESQHWHKIKIEVRDTGIGIAAERQNILFEAFSQAEGSTTRHFGGSGLGLNICKEIVDAMGGDIYVSSIPNRGSLFTIIVALRLSQEPADTLSNTAPTSIATANQTVDIEHLKVLVAEDNEINRKVLIGQIQRLGPSVDSAEDGEQAYSMFQQKDYDIVLSDCHMPHMDGFTLASLINTERQSKRPILLAITADAMSDAAQKCLDSGFDDYLSKPCQIATLHTKLIEACQSLTKLHASRHDSKVDGVTLVKQNLVNEVKTNARPDQLLNRAYILELSGGDYELVFEVLQAYKETSVNDCTELLSAYDNFSDKKVTDLAHRIKGSLRYLGADLLVKHTENIELIAMNGATPELDALINDLTLGIKVLTEEVTQWCDEISAKT